MDAPSPDTAGPPPGFAGFHGLPAGGPPARAWWEHNAADYVREHGDFLGPAEFTWCPEGLREDDAGLLGPVRGRRVLEVGAGAAQCSRWVARRGGRPVAIDLAAGMLREARAIDASLGTDVPVLQADARALPFEDASFDVAFSAFGAVPFVADAGRIHDEVARVLRPGGTWTFSVTHPIRWAFPDDPDGLTATRSYFDRRPYVETDDAGHLAYAEHHRTLGDHVAEVTGAGFVLERLVEPEWPEGHARTWGGWGPVRGALLPGTAIFCTRRP